MAKSILSDNKLTCEVVEQYSDLPYGTVILQSVAKDTMIAQTSVVTITVSKGFESDQGSTEQTRSTYEFKTELPPMHYAYTLVIYQDEVEVYRALQAAAGGDFTLTLVGISGATSEVQVNINDTVWGTHKVIFP